LSEIQSQGNKWLVSDFVTLGSPLTHAALLMAVDAKQLSRKQSQREFPTCPPCLETVEQQERFSFEKQKVWVPHHAAVFAPTRWTNLYFPCRYTLWGDIIGGPMAPSFGRGVRDVAVSTNIRGEIFSHTLYWTRPEGTATAHIQVLRAAVNLCP
jgi:hypothetical protein